MSMNHAGKINLIEGKNYARANISAPGNDDMKKQQSPAAQLHEYLAKHGVQWEYKEITSSGSDHQKSFRAAVVFEGFTFCGEGNQKKIAKQNAARIALESLETNRSLLAAIKLKASCSASSVSTEKVSNCVSILMEYCAKNKYSRPEFIQTYESTSPDSPFFKFSCCLRVLNIFTEGSGSTKSKAKELAAQAALLEIDLKRTFKSSSSIPSTNVIEIHNPETRLMMKLKFLEDLEATPFDRSILVSIRNEQFDFSNHLLQIMNGKVEYLELYLRLEKEYRCVCQLYADDEKNVPIFVTWGKSKQSMEEAKKLACRRAIYVLLCSRND